MDKKNAASSSAAAQKEAPPVVTKTFTAKDAAQLPHFRQNHDVFRRFLATFLPVPGFPIPPPGSDETVSCHCVVKLHYLDGRCEQSTTSIELPKGLITTFFHEFTLRTPLYETFQARFGKDLDRSCEFCWGCHKTWKEGEFATFDSIIRLVEPRGDEPLETICIGCPPETGALFHILPYAVCADSAKCKEEGKRAFHQHIMKDLGDDQLDPATMHDDPSWAHGCNGCRDVEEKPLSFLKCGRCLGVLYCSKECQAKDWEEHKTVCKKPERQGNEGRTTKSGKKDKKGRKKSAKKN